MADWINCSGGDNETQKSSRLIVHDSKKESNKNQLGEKSTLSIVDAARRTGFFSKKFLPLLLLRNSFANSDSSRYIANSYSSNGFIRPVLPSKSNQSWFIFIAEYYAEPAGPAEFTTIRSWWTWWNNDKSTVDRSKRWWASPVLSTLQFEIEDRHHSLVLSSWPVDSSTLLGLLFKLAMSNLIHLTQSSTLSILFNKIFFNLWSCTHHSTPRHRDLRPSHSFDIQLHYHLLFPFIISLSLSCRDQNKNNSHPMSRSQCLSITQRRPHHRFRLYYQQSRAQWKHSSRPWTCYY